MELVGQTMKYTYANTNTCHDAHMEKKDPRYSIPLPTAKWGPHQLPWRTTRYLIPETSSYGVTNPNAHKYSETYGAEYQIQQYPNDAPLSLTPFCHPCQVNNGVLFPFRKVIVGSKYFLLPYKDPLDNKYQTNTGFDVHIANKSVAKPVQFDKNVSDRAQDLINLGCDSQRPNTPPLGRSSWLDAFINFKQNSGNIKDAACPLVPPTMEENPAIHQQIEHRIKCLKENTPVYNTPMSHFKSDGRFLTNALRTYKRDTELLKERCQYTDDKMFSDVGKMDWYKDMMANPDAAPLDTRIESALLCSDFVPVHDAIGGCSYLDPKMRGDLQLRHDMACNDTFSGLICQNFRPTVTTINRRPPAAKSNFECEIEDNLRAINNRINHRNMLLTMLANSEQSIHENKGTYHKLPDHERNSTQHMREMGEAEKCRRNILLQLGHTEKQLDTMMRYQHVLEAHMAKHRLETSLHS